MVIRSASNCMVWNGMLSFPSNCGRKSKMKRRRRRFSMLQTKLECKENKKFCLMLKNILQIFGTTFNAALNLGVQNVGASFLSVAAFNYMCLKSRDETVIGSIALSKAMVKL